MLKRFNQHTLDPKFNVSKNIFDVHYTTVEPKPLLSNMACFLIVLLVFEVVFFFG